LREGRRSHRRLQETVRYAAIRPEQVAHVL
jgi:hypothetical protein